MKPPKIEEPPKTTEALKPTAEPASIIDQLQAILDTRSKPTRRRQRDEAPMINRPSPPLLQVSGSDVRPVPDPTSLTTLQIDTAIKALREIIETRLAGMDRAIHLAESDQSVFPNRIDEKISAVAGILEERFRSIGVQFHERDVREERTSRDGKLAIDAALQAAKEAVNAQNTSSAMAIAKSEAAAIKQIDQQGATIQSIKAALDDKIGDLKDRMLIFEGRGFGVKEAKTEGRDTGQYWIAIGGALLGVAGLGLAVIMAFLKNQP